MDLFSSPEDDQSPFRELVKCCTYAPFDTQVEACMHDWTLEFNRPCAVLDCGFPTFWKGMVCDDGTHNCDCDVDL